MTACYKSQLCTQGRLIHSGTVIFGDIRTGPDRVVNEIGEETESYKKHFGLDEKITINITNESWLRRDK